jgi:hypothetical protein
MTARSKSSIAYRHQIIHDDDADLIAYQLRLNDGTWQTLSQWMIPSTEAALRQPKA